MLEKSKGALENGICFVSSFSKKNQMTTYASYLKGLEGRLGRGPTSLRSTDVVVIVDLQRDFVPHAHGAGTPSSFGVRGGEQIVRPVCDLVSTMLKARGSVVCTRD